MTIETESYTINWRDKVIGHFIVLSSDMWYWEGRWEPNENTASSFFQELVTPFNATDILKDPVKGTRIVLTNEKAPYKHIQSLVISLSDGILFIRTCATQEAEQWLIKHVN